jgi:hypothetical protein
MNACLGLVGILPNPQGFREFLCKDVGIPPPDLTGNNVRSRFSQFNLRIRSVSDTVLAAYDDTYNTTTARGITHVTGAFRSWGLGCTDRDNKVDT